jgi:hypothetical protein
MGLGFLPPEPDSGLYAFENTAVSLWRDLSPVEDWMALAVHLKTLHGEAKPEFPPARKGR